TTPLVRGEAIRSEVRHLSLCGQRCGTITYIHRRSCCPRIDVPPTRPLKLTEGDKYHVALGLIGGRRRHSRVVRDALSAVWRSGRLGCQGAATRCLPGQLSRQWLYNQGKRAGLLAQPLRRTRGREGL